MRNRGLVGTGGLGAGLRHPATTPNGSTLITGMITTHHSMRRRARAKLVPLALGARLYIYCSNVSVSPDCRSHQLPPAALLLGGRTGSAVQPQHPQEDSANTTSCNHGFHDGSCTRSSL